MSLIKQVNNYADCTIFVRITDQESYESQHPCAHIVKIIQRQFEYN